MAGVETVLPKARTSQVVSALDDHVGYLRWMADWSTLLQDVCLAWMVYIYTFMVVLGGGSHFVFAKVSW